MSLGGALRKLRHKRDLTLAILAQKTGSHVGNLSRIERDEAKPSLDLLYRLSEAMDYSMVDIFSVADSRYTSPDQEAMNVVFISLLQEDQTLLVDFAQLLQKRAIDGNASALPTRLKQKTETESEKKEGKTVHMDSDNASAHTNPQR